MRAFLDAALLSMDRGQRDAIVELLDRLRKDGVIRTQEEFEFSLERLVRAITDGSTSTPSFVYTDVNFGPVSSEKFNIDFQRLYVDLVGLFGHTARMAATVLRHEDLQDEIYVQIRDAVRKLLVDLKTYRFLKANPEYNEVHYAEFWNCRNNYSGVDPALVEPQTQELVLRPHTNQRLASRRGPQAPKITVEHLTSSLEGTPHRFAPERAIDNRLDTFWADVRLADDPVKTSYSSTSYDGVIVKATVDFTRLEFLNNLRVLPFAEFPVSLIDVQYSTDMSTWTTLPGFTATTPSLDWQVIRFPRIEARAVRILMHQPNYRERVFLVRRSQLRHSLLWDQILQGYYGAEVEDATQLADWKLQEVEVDRDFSTYVNALERYNTEVKKRNFSTNGTEVLDDIRKQADAISTILAELDPESKTVVLRSLAQGDLDESYRDEFDEIRKIEYVLGAFHIEPGYLLYNHKGVWHSPRWECPATIMEARLDSTEAQEYETDSHGDSVPITSVEHVLEVAKDKYLNILPSNIELRAGVPFVRGEYLMIRPENRTAELRFSPITIIAVRAGRDVLSPSKYSVNGRRVTIDPSVYYNGMIYTVDYTTSADNEVVDVEATWNSTELLEPEVFAETDSQARVQLKYHPYVSWEIIHGAEAQNPVWIKSRPRIAEWTFRPDADPVTIDGLSYGNANTSLSSAVAAADTTINVISTSDFPSTGTLLVESTTGATEQIKYTSTTATTFEGLTRGARGTSPTDWSASTVVRLSSKQRYAPVVITVDGVLARNRTNYLTGINPAFVQIDTEDIHSYIQVGRTIYFDRPISDRRIEVRYRHLAQYVQLKTTLRCNIPVARYATPAISDLRVKLKTARR